MVDVPIDSPCCVVLTDSRNTGVISDKCKTKLTERSRPNFYKRHNILLIGAIFILLICLFLVISNLAFSIIFGHDAHNASVRIEPETRMGRLISLAFPLGRRSSKSQAGRVIDEDSSFGDQTEPTNQITGGARGDAFPTIDGGDADKRSKREVYRKKRDCDLTAKHCEALLLTMQNYLVALKTEFAPTSSGKSLSADILRCLDCKKLQNIADKYDKDHTPRSKDLYFPHDYAEQNRSSDSGIAVIKLLDDAEAENGSKRMEVNRTEAAKIQPMETDSVVNSISQNVANQSLTDTSILETTTPTISIDHTDSNVSQRIYEYVKNINTNSMVSVDDKQSNDNPAVNDSRVMKTKNDENVSAVFDVNQQHRVTTESKGLTSILETTTPTILIDHTDSNASQRMYVKNINTNSMVSVDDKQSDDNPAVNDSRVMKTKNDENVPAVFDVNQQHRVTTESKGLKSVKLWFTTESSSTGTAYSAITGGEQSKKTTITADSVGTTETSTRTTIDLTAKQTAITENVTSVPAGYDVTGIDGGTMHPSARPSFEGHPENRSAITANVTGSMESHRIDEQIMPADRLQTKENGKPIPVTTESTKSFQQLQVSPTTRTMLHPVCFYGYPGQSSDVPLSPASEFPSSFDPSSAQSRGFPFQNTLHQGSASPNYMQVQFLPRFNYASNLAQPTGQDIGPMGPAVSNAPISSLNQQPNAMSQQPTPNMPYFCAYMSLPTLRFPPIPDTSQSDRSSVEAKDLSKESQKSSLENKVITQDYNPQHPPLECPINYLQCNNLYCISKAKWCDGRVDCTDASDETRCSCRDRISRDQLCDGYFDCPYGEDELSCFDCPGDSFSCDDWETHSCVPLSQRCDGIRQCSNGKDELDCNILSESYMDPNDIFTIGYTQGYLHTNIRGQWYPVCSMTLSWAMDACASEIGRLLTTMPDVQTVEVPENIFHGSCAIESDNNKIQLTSRPGIAVFVKCPPLPCGTKAHLRQDFSPAHMTRNYISKRHAEEQSAAEIAKFNKLYQETLGLLDASQSVSDKKVQDQNDTLVGVVGGRASQPRAWPFLVAIYKDGEFHCGGVILSEVHVLTASHCMRGYKAHYYEIQAGTLRQLSFSPMAQLRKVKYVTIHPDYENQAKQNDIAVITLDKPLLFNRWVRQVCLPELNTAGPEWKEGPLPQSMCVAIGWGAIKENGPDSVNLREVEVPILSSCKYLYDQNNATICAGYPEGGHDTCQGDSGGPLMCRNPNLESQWYAAGIISHGNGCARPNEPGVYMKVSYYVDWIQQTFEDLNNTVTSSDENRPLDSCLGFNCQTGLGNCLPEENRCDGIVNCLDGEDEVGCDFIRISHGKYRESDSRNPSKPQANETSSDTTEKNQVSTEAIPISTSSRFLYQTETQTDNNENSNTNIYATTPGITMSSVRSTFTCKSIIQTITINKKCDKRLDCEDGTDEEDCTCRDYLSNFQPAAICDGHLDCDDETDEKDCGICKGDEFHCSRSGGCIPMAKKCDAKFDCRLNEDELDCLALSDGEYVNVDNDNRPVLNTEGLLSRYYNETWHIECPHPNILENNTKASLIGGNLCKYLGFASLQSLDKIVVNKTVLETRLSRRWDNMTGYEPLPKHVAASEEDETCTTLRFRCKPVLSSSADSHLVVEPKTGSHTYLWPWLAAIFVDGRYHCSALLLEPDWLLSSSSCTEDIRLSVNYTTAVLGRSRSFLYVDGPHERISVIDEIRDVKTSDVSLLHLKTATNLTRYVQPLFLEKKIYPPAKNDLCVAIGTDNEHETRSIFLQPILENCDKCYRCFVSVLDIECPANGTSSDWSGTVFCRSEKGWYPAAVFHENDGPCSFRSTRNLTSIDYIHAYLTQALEKEPHPIPEATCDGVRCNIGQCVPWNQVCDGVADCRDGADEKSEMCLYEAKQAGRRNGANHECAKSELRCKNGECVSKSAFCNREVDCSDGTDEPVICNCAEYLKLTTPERLCDGVRHCFDKTDESPEVCQCTETSFKCNAESKNLTCISKDFVCDGDNDCPDGEDETECIKVNEVADNRFAAGEVTQRSYGVWHTRCYPLPVTSREEAVNVCKKSGYADGNIDYTDLIFNEPIFPSLDGFHMIRLNPYMWIIMRDDKPLITLDRPKEPCYRIFVKCNISLTKEKTII